MFLKDSRRRKFTELVAHHVLGHEHGLKILSVMNQKRVADKIRRHHRTPRPGLDRFLGVRGVHLVDLFQKMRLDEGSFLQRSTHKNQTFFFDFLRSKMKRSLGLCFVRVLNPFASCPHGLTG